MIKHNIELAKGQKWTYADDLALVVNLSEDQVVYESYDIGGFHVLRKEKFLGLYTLSQHQNKHNLEDGFEYTETLPPGDPIGWEAVGSFGCKTLLRRKLVDPSKPIECGVDRKVTYDGSPLMFNYDGRWFFLDYAERLPAFVGYIFDMPDGTRTPPVADSRKYWNPEHAGVWNPKKGCAVPAYRDGCIVIHPAAVAIMDERKTGMFWPFTDEETAELFGKDTNS